MGNKENGGKIKKKNSWEQEAWMPMMTCSIMCAEIKLLHSPLHKQGFNLGIMSGFNVLLASMIWFGNIADIYFNALII